MKQRRSTEWADDVEWTTPPWDLGLGRWAGPCRWSSVGKPPLQLPPMALAVVARRWGRAMRTLADKMNDDRTEKETPDGRVSVHRRRDTKGWSGRQAGVKGAMPSRQRLTRG